MTITGESFDYGPYRFLPRYDPAFVAAYFDHAGLYAYGRQPRAMLRNVLRLVAALRPIAPHVVAESVAAEFEARLQQETTRHVVQRLGLVPRLDVDATLVDAVYAFLDASGIGYDRFFFDLHGGLEREPFALAGPAASHYRGPTWDALREALGEYLSARDPLARYFESDAPCSLLIEEIESIWTAIAERDDWAPFCDKIRKIREMGAALGRAA
jgi:uncharacterized protein YdiU (UPF0061 family)